MQSQLNQNLYILPHPLCEKNDENDIKSQLNQYFYILDCRKFLVLKKMFNQNIKSNDSLLISTLFSLFFQNSECPEKKKNFSNAIIIYFKFPPTPTPTPSKPNPSTTPQTTPKSNPDMITRTGSTPVIRHKTVNIDYLMTDVSPSKMVTPPPRWWRRSLFILMKRSMALERPCLWRRKSMRRWVLVSGWPVSVVVVAAKDMWKGVFWF